MNTPDKKRKREEQEPEPEIQQGDGRSTARDDELKRIVRQHPQRDEPLVDSIEEDEGPGSPPASGR